MTDRETLFQYRLREAEETLLDAERMLVEKYSPRSIVNRAYYCMFYGMLALFIKSDIDITTSKHSGVISKFDKKFVHTGKFEHDYSKMIHKTFLARLKADYKDLVEISEEEAAICVGYARELLSAIKRFATQAN